MKWTATLAGVCELKEGTRLTFYTLATFFRDFTLSHFKNTIPEIL